MFWGEQRGRWRIRPAAPHFSKALHCALEGDDFKRAWLRGISESILSNGPCNPREGVDCLSVSAARYLFEQRAVEVLGFGD